MQIGSGPIIKFVGFRTSLSYLSANFSIFYYLLYTHKDTQKIQKWELDKKAFVFQGHVFFSFFRGILNYLEPRPLVNKSHDLSLFQNNPQLTLITGIPNFL